MSKYKEHDIIEKVLDVKLMNERFTDFFLGAYLTRADGVIQEHSVLYKGSIEKITDNPLVRINSACFTGDIFGDRRCDCHDQFLQSLMLISEKGGLLIYHFGHEGRGVGYTKKLQSMKHSAESGLTTFDAHQELFGSNDLRTYGASIAILKDLGIDKLRLISNSPLKEKTLCEAGIRVSELVPVISKNATHDSILEAKRDHQGHKI